jgi:antitoxin PrlF
MRVTRRKVGLEILGGLRELRRGEIGRVIAVRLMPTQATLSNQGRTTLPKAIPDSLGLRPGDRINFTLMPDRTIVLRVKAKSVLDLAGSLPKKGRKPVAITRHSR